MNKFIINWSIFQVIVIWAFKQFSWTLSTPLPFDAYPAFISIHYTFPHFSYLVNQRIISHGKIHHLPVHKFCWLWMFQCVTQIGLPLRFCYFALSFCFQLTNRIVSKWWMMKTRSIQGESLGTRQTDEQKNRHVLYQTATKRFNPICSKINCLMWN